MNLLIDSRLEIINTPIVQYKLVRVKGEMRLSYAYCSAFSINTKRTRYICQHPRCRLPLCSVGWNKDNKDCFALAHRSEEMRNALCKRLRKMKNNLIIGRRQGEVEIIIIKHNLQVHIKLNLHAIKFIIIWCTSNMKKH